MTDKGKNVYQMIAEVTAKMAKEGISKDRKNQQQGYSFRGIDDVYNVLGGMLADVGLIILPRLISESVVERNTKNGGLLIYSKVRMKYRFVSSQDGSATYAEVSGEAMDSADKSTNKAMSAAYKYMAMQAFCIPTEGDNDADASTPEPAPKPQKSGTKQATQAIPAENPKPMPDAEYEAARIAVSSADSMEALQKAFTEAYTAAKAYGDKPAMEGLTKLKDFRKKELQPQSQGE